MKKYGKDLSDIAGFKNSFFEDDRKLLEENLYISSIAKKQEKRLNCKNCSIILNDEIDFIKHDIPYKLCRKCGHLNAIYDDTEELAKAIYVDEVTNYSKVYSSSSKKVWLNRMEKVYIPKAEFLKEILLKDDVNELPNVTDLGAGSGYLVKALSEVGFSEPKGVEVSQQQVELSKNMLDGEYVEKIDLNDLIAVIQNTSTNVITMIGVLEHLTNPREILTAIKENDNIKYLYLSVPLLSYSVFFEILNQHHYNRHLSGGHTHLYSLESINYLCEEFGFEIIGEWQFGVDAMDLFRFNSLDLKEKLSDRMFDIYSEKFTAILNEMQLIFDKNNFSSETHIVLKKIN